MRLSGKSDHANEMLKKADTLSEEDRAAFQGILSAIQAYTGQTDSWYWYPLWRLKKELPVSVYDLDAIYHDKKIKLLEKTFREFGIETVKSFQMQIPNLGVLEKNILSFLYEKDGKAYEFPWYAETFYYDDSHTWMLYVSHEDTITFTGEKLVDIAKRNIPAKYLYE